MTQRAERSPRPPTLVDALGVSTAAYFPYCFFNLLSPILDVLYGYLGFKVQTIPPADAVVQPPPEVDGREVLTADQPAPANRLT